MNPLSSVETTFDRTDCRIVATIMQQPGVMVGCPHRQRLYHAVAIASLLHLVLREFAGQLIAPYSGPACHS